MTSGSIHSLASDQFLADKRKSLSSRSLANSTNTSIYRTRTLQCLSEEKRAKRVHFYRNGDRFHGGITYAISSVRFRTFDALLTDLTRTLSDKVNLPFGVRSIFVIRGWRKIKNLDEFQNGECYVCSSSDSCKKIDYLRNTNPSWSQTSYGGAKSQSMSQLHQRQLSFNDHSRFREERRSLKSSRDFIKPKVITVIRNEVKPRKAIKVLLNKKTAHSLEQVANEITTAIKLDSGAVRKIYTLSGKEVTSLSDFFGDEEVFIACGLEKLCNTDFGIDQGLLKPSTPQVRRRSLRARPKPLMELSKGNSEKDKQSVSKVPIPVKKSSTVQDHPPDLKSQYKLRSKIGDGHFATVKECISRTTGQRFALKIIDKRKSLGSGYEIENELSILRQIRHPNIVQVIEDFVSDDKVYFVMELANGGDLFDAITSCSSYSEIDASGMLRNLSSALAYLHQRSIVHRDVKPENLLLFHFQGGAKALKLADFGLATFVNGPLNLVCGTPAYVAPEIILQKGYGLEVDIWAAGVITYILLCGSPPFHSQHNDQEELFDLIIKGSFSFPSPYWDLFSQSVKDLIMNMLHQDHNSRITALQILEHPWVKGDEASDRDMKSYISQSLSSNFLTRDKV